MNIDTNNILRHWREDVPNDRMAHLIRDTERAFRKSLQVRLARFKVPFGHWTFLRILWQNDGLTQKELSQRAGVMEPTTFAAIKAMEASGYVRRSQLPSNKKNVYVHLSAKGRALKNKLVPLAEEVNRAAVAEIPLEHIAVTRETLLSIIENLARNEAQSQDPEHRIPSTRELASRVAAGSKRKRA